MRSASDDVISGRYDESVPAGRVGASSTSWMDAVQRAADPPHRRNRISRIGAPRGKEAGDDVGRLLALAGGALEPAHAGAGEAIEARRRRADAADDPQVRSLRSSSAAAG